MSYERICRLRPAMGLRRLDSGTDAPTNFFFYASIIIMFVSCGLYNFFFKRRLEAQLLAQQQVQEQVYRQDVIASDQDMENLWACEVCDFKNYDGHRTCILCGTERDFTLKAKRDEMNSAKSSEFVLMNDATPRTLKKQALFTKNKLNNLNARQKGARRRHDWVRNYDEGSGNVVWGRKKNDRGLKRIAKGAIHDQVVDALDSSNALSMPMLRDSFSSVSSTNSTQSVGYITKLIMSPSNPDGRMSFEVAEGQMANQNFLHNGAVVFAPAELKTVSGLTFQQKHAWFVQYTSTMEIPWEYGHMLLEIDRTNLLHNSCEQLLWATTDQLHQSMRIKFLNEPGVDAGGLEREWFTLMTQEIFDDSTGLFTSCMGQNSFMIRATSNEASEDHLMYFQAIGRFLGRALFEGMLIDAHLSLPMYKHILGIPITFSDLEFIDVDLYNNLRWLKQNNGVESLCLDFSVNVAQYGGAPLTIDLCPNGRNIPVTDDNKDDYVYLRFKWIMMTSISYQLASLIKGMYSVVPAELLSVFDHQELELLMCGIPDINVADWRTHTTYIGDCDAQVIDWFWEIVEDFSTEQRARLLQFTTGSARVPVQGFKTLTMNDGRICLFAIQGIKKEECLYPRAHTCFNRLDLPMYSTKKDLETALMMVIKMEVTGFTIE
ncbi:HECT E3 ubiquitin ligase [Thraustotheca clavata]|uniref:HECT-type E3 ubiquitin transferase n=1 Tax=Thraustotheca clavata TaxID=74557 RepID=A0A1V9YVA8_9STRA|nr:HECT E3 ubiquitin ligase [Thraustotheca clavata]